MPGLIGCLSFDLTPQRPEKLDEVNRIELGFPHDITATDQYRAVVDGGYRFEGGPLGARALFRHRGAPNPSRRRS
jgi:hypothetical protein